MPPTKRLRQIQTSKPKRVMAKTRTKKKRTTAVPQKVRAVLQNMSEAIHDKDPTEARSVVSRIKALRKTHARWFYALAAVMVAATAGYSIYSKGGGTSMATSTPSAPAATTPAVLPKNAATTAQNFAQQFPNQSKAATKSSPPTNDREYTFTPRGKFVMRSIFGNKIDSSKPVRNINLQPHLESLTSYQKRELARAKAYNTL